MNSWNSFIGNKSIKLRFIATLLGNVIKVAVSFVTGTIIARGLGPAGYGNFNFLLGSFVSIAALLDMGTSSAFYTFLSQRKRSSAFYFYYLAWLLGQFLIISVSVYIIFPDSWVNKIWLGHNRNVVLLAFFASFMMNKIWQTSVHTGESIRSTVIVQMHNVVLAVVYLSIVLGMVLLHSLTLVNLLLVITFNYIFFTVLLIKRLKRNLIEPQKTNNLTLKDIFNDYKVYCIPLLIYNVVSFAYSFADLWLLQTFGGAKEQGFYSIGQQFSVLNLIVTTSILQIFWKEIAEATANQNRERVERLYFKTLKPAYFVGALMSCFLIPYSRDILRIVLGAPFESAWLCLAVMFLYPIHQSIGQICSTLLYAKGNTKTYTIYGVITMVMSIPVTYFVLAPSNSLIRGLGLGSTGLAFKMVILQIIGVNILAYLISRIYHWKFELWYQFLSVGALLGCSFVAKSSTGKLFANLEADRYFPLYLICSFLLYSLGAVVVIYLFPSLLGITKSDLYGRFGFTRQESKAVRPVP